MHSKAEARLSAVWGTDDTSEGKGDAIISSVV